MFAGNQQQLWSGPLPSNRRRADRVPRTPLVDEGVIHDLLNPMTSIVGHLHLVEDLLEQHPVGDMGERWLAACRTGVEELTDMLVDLRRLMQVETGELKIDPRPLAVAPLLDRVRDRESERAALKNQLVRIDPAEPGLEIHADEELAERTLRLILAAALRLARSSPIVFRAGRTPGGMVRFRCCYEGRTMSPRLADRLFTRDGARVQEMHGQRADRARGLPLARAVARAHAGDAWCQPTAAGACFHLALPAPGPR